VNRPNDHRSHPGGWQATPGQPIPRAARQPAANGLLLVMLLLVWFSPLSILAWLLGQAVILLQRRWHWWRFTLASLGAIGVVLAVTGPEEALRRHIFVPQHFWQYVALHFGFGPSGTRVTVGQFLWDLLATQVWLAVPVGLLAASLSVWNAERAAGGAEWSPFGRRRQRIDQRACDRRTARLLANPRDYKLTTPALGVALDGDLASWRQGRYVVPPAQLRGKAMAVVGAPGAGKTVTLLRLAYLAAVLGRKVCFADCKGTDPTLVPALIAAYRLGNPQARVGCWPQQAMDMWRGTAAQVQSRLLAVEVFTEPFYQRVASAGLRLALTAPDMPPVDGSDELLRRLDADELAALWEGRPLQLKDIEAIGEHLAGARLRYADFFAALAGAFDRGTWSYEDVDLAVLTVPTLLSKAEADAAMRVVLEDYGHYTTGRKPREGEDALLVLDEFSALASGVDSAINLAERVRDVGVQVVVAAQSVEGLGDHRQAPRLLASCAGGIVVQQCPDPERLLALAGQERALEHNWELDFYGPRGFAKARMGERPRIDPEQVRQAQPGDAWVIQAGQSIHLRVLPRPPWPLSQLSWPTPCRGPTTPSDCRSRSRPRSESPPPPPWPAGLSARSASAPVGGASARGGCRRRRGGPGCPGGPYPGGDADEAAWHGRGDDPSASPPHPHGRCHHRQRVTARPDQERWRRVRATASGRAGAPAGRHRLLARSWTAGGRLPRSGPGRARAARPRQPRPADAADAATARPSCHPAPGAPATR
jgi:hypothetical protein